MTKLGDILTAMLYLEITIGLLAIAVHGTTLWQKFKRLVAKSIHMLDEMAGRGIRWAYGQQEKNNCMMLTPEFEKCIVEDLDEETKRQLLLNGWQEKAEDNIRQIETERIFQTIVEGSMAACRNDGFETVTSTPKSEPNVLFDSWCRSVSEKEENMTKLLTLEETRKVLDSYGHCRICGHPNSDHNSEHPPSLFDKKLFVQAWNEPNREFPKYQPTFDAALAAIRRRENNNNMQQALLEYAYPIINDKQTTNTVTDEDKFPLIETLEETVDNLSSCGLCYVCGNRYSEHSNYRKDMSNFNRIHDGDEHPPSRFKKDELIVAWEKCKAGYPDRLARALKLIEKRENEKAAKAPTAMITPEEILKQGLANTPLFLWDYQETKNIVAMNTDHCGVCGCWKEEDHVCAGSCFDKDTYLRAWHDVYAQPGVDARIMLGNALSLIYKRDNPPPKPKYKHTLMIKVSLEPNEVDIAESLCFNTDFASCLDFDVLKDELAQQLVRQAEQITGNTEIGAGLIIKQIAIETIVQDEIKEENSETT